MDGRPLALGFGGVKVVNLKSKLIWSSKGNWLGSPIIEVAELIP